MNERDRSPLNVLMTADAAGGVWTYVSALAAALPPEAATVTVALMGPPADAADRARIEALPHARLHHRPYRLEWMPDPWNDVDRAAAWLLELARDTRADLVHVNGYAHAAVAFDVPALLVAHSCVCSWWRAVKGERAPAEWNEYRRRVRAGLARAAVVAAPTSSMLRALRDEYGFDRDAILIPNGLPQRPDNHVPKEAFALIAGRLWDEAKNFKALDAIAAALPWPIVAAGSLDGPDGLKGTPRCLQYLGHLMPAVLASWMDRAAIYALPARYEPFGLSVLEAAQAGCALVLADIPSLREVWGDAAVYVAPDAPDAWRVALASVMEGAALRRALQHAARRRARQYTDRRMAARYLSIYRRLVDTSATHGAPHDPAYRTSRHATRSPARPRREETPKCA
jgi:glycogen synthase